MVSESDISIQGHGVHTAYVEMVNALKKRPDIELTTGEFDMAVDCDVIHLHTVGSRVWRKLLQRGPKKVVSAHVVPDSFIGSLVLARYWRFAAVWYLRWFYNRADLVLAVSKEAQQDLIDLGVRTPIKLLYNFIDTARYRQPVTPTQDVRQALSIDRDAFVVIGAGQIQPRKRVDWFIDAAKQLPDVHFIWVGGMPFGKIAADSAKMDAMMQAAPSNVHFPGIVPLDAMNDYYQAADVFCLPSEQETFGLVVVEAAAAGLPVILRDIPDYVDTFAGDALYAQDESFVRVIEQLRADQALRSAWQKHAAAIAARFDSVAAAERLTEMYRRLLG